MSFSSKFSVVLFALLLSHAPASFAQMLIDPPPVGNDHAWDCWISSDPTQKIASYLLRCIRDREISPDEPPNNTPQSVLLDVVHDRIHRGETVELDLDLANGRFNDVLSYMWRIRIHQYPYEESFQQAEPELLVQALLCRPTVDCAVHVQR